MRNLKLQKIKPLFHPLVKFQHQEQIWTSLLFPTLDNHENIWKLYCVPTPGVHSSHSRFYTILVAFLWIVLLVHVSYKSWPTVVQMSQDQQRSLKPGPVIGWMNSWSSWEVESIFKSLFPLRAHIKLTNNRTISKLFPHMICPSSACLEYQGYTVLFCSPVCLPLSTGLSISDQGLHLILWLQCLIP